MNSLSRVIAAVSIASAAFGAGAAEDLLGKGTYEGVCAPCHGTGAAGAPKVGDAGAWAPRIKTGLNALYASALKGKGAMPPKGGNPSLPDIAVQAAVRHMVALSQPSSAAAAAPDKSTAQAAAAKAAP